MGAESEEPYLNRRDFMKKTAAAIAGLAAGAPLVEASDANEGNEGFESAKQILIEEFGNNMNEQGFSFAENEEKRDETRSRWRATLHKRLKNDAGLVLSDVTQDDGSVFDAELIRYLIDNGYYAVNGSIEIQGKRPIYQNVYPVTDEESVKIGEYFSEWLKYAEGVSEEQLSTSIPVLHVGDGLVESHLAFFDSLLKGQYKAGNVVLFPGSRGNATLANELGHAFFERVLGFRPEDGDKTFFYEGERWTVSQLNELVSDVSELRFADCYQIHSKTEGNPIGQYALSHKILSEAIDRVSEEGMSEDVLVYLEQKIFYELCPIAKQAVERGAS